MTRSRNMRQERERIAGLVERLIQVLDVMDADPDMETGADDEESPVRLYDVRSLGARVVPLPFGRRAA